MGRGTRSALRFATALAVLSTAGCTAAVTGAGASPSDAAATASGDGGPAPVGLTGMLAQNREDEVRGVAVVRLVNHGTATVTVDVLTLQWPGLVPASPTTPRYPLTPGVPVDLTVGYGPARCAVDGSGAPSATSAPPADPPVAAATVDGSATEVALADGASRALAALLYRRSCGAQAVAAAVDVSLGDSWTSTQVGGLPALAGVLTVRRRAATGTVLVPALAGSVLLSFVPSRSTTPVLALSPTQASASAAVALLTSGRCDGHALGESKKPFALTVEVDDGDGVTRPVTVTPGAAVRTRLWRVIGAGCRLPALTPASGR